jgi:aerobic carbon-monoxide dehydrogenase large subunit
MGETATAEGVGAAAPRLEDERYLRGKGEFIADIRLAGMRDLAFVRSPLAHARITSIRKPAGHEAAVFVAQDLVGVQPIVAVSGLPGFKPSVQPVLATEKVRHVGEAIAVCVAETRAAAEDLAAAVEVDFDELPPVVDMRDALASTTRLHDHWDNNVFLETFVQVAPEQFSQPAPIVVRRRLRTARQCMSPIEGRGVIATWDRRLEQLLVYSSTQMPHIVRTGLAGCLGLEQARIRVVAPDVGGGFGYKGILLPEEVCAAWLARRLGHPVRWIEDRREQLTGNANCREHDYDITLHAEADGRLIGIDAEAVVDAGAYSIYPFSACLEAAQVASILPGPYMMRAYRCRTFSAATNKPPILPYRGVARSGVCFALEVALDAVARQAGLEPHEVRLRNLVPADAMPFENITNKLFDSGDYPECLRRVIAAIDLPGVRRRQAEMTGPLRIGFGCSIFCEQAAHGTSVYAGWGIPMVPGFEQAVARMTPDGGLELRVGIQNHGQGLETTLAQVAHEILGIPLASIRVVHGDTALTPYSTGTWGSRCMVMAGGAVASACREIEARARQIGASLLQVKSDDVEFVDGKVVSATADVSMQDIARAWYLRPQDLPADVHRGGLEATVGYKPERDSGTFSYAAHAVTVAVDPELGEVEILDYVIVEDGGKLVNPMVVEGQIYGGLAQGIGTALYEEMPFDSNGQPLATTFADYLLPGPAEVPEPRLDHMETLAPYTEFGVKGLGEGGAIAPPAAIANAVNDALKGLGAELLYSPITPRRVLESIAAAKVRRASIAVPAGARS